MNRVRVLLFLALAGIAVLAVSVDAGLWVWCKPPWSAVATECQPEQRV